MDVYKASAFSDRVNYAAAVISKGKQVYNSRVFDTCFEMGDGDYVVAALVRRSLKNPESQLAKNLFKFVGKIGALDSYEQTKNLTRAQLRDEAVKTAVEGCLKIGYQNI